MIGNAGEARADRNRDAVVFRRDPEHAFVGNVVAQQDRPAAGERREFHQLAHAGGLVEPDLLDLDHELAGQQLDRAIRHFGQQGRGGLQNRALLVRREAIVNGQ